MRHESAKRGAQRRPGTWRRAALKAFAGVMNRDRRRLLIHALRTTIAASLCWWLATRFGLREGYWGAISAIIVLQAHVGATIQASRDRMLGTLVGAVLGFSCTLLGTLPWNYIVAVFLAAVVCGLLGFRNSSRLAGVTVTIVMLVQSNSPRTVALDRVLQVVLGIMVAVAVTLLIFPRRGRHTSPERPGLNTQFAEADSTEHGE